MSILAMAATALLAFVPFFVDAASRDAGSLRRTFRSPQGAARANTGPLFWMHGTETEARLREYVGKVAESGQGVLTMESRPHKDWMREGWWRDVDIVLDECRKRGLKAIVFDDYWWPSQGMGGKYPIPEKFHCVDIKGEVYSVKDAPRGKIQGEICRVSAKETSCGVFSLCADGDKVIVFSTAPLDYSSFPRFPTVNGLDEEAVDWFLATYYQPYWDRCRAAFEDGTIAGFFFDEPQFMSWWGPALAKELEARGENIAELLTALKFRLSDPEAQARAYYRYIDARAETWGRTMYGRQSEWCRERGVYSSGHFEEHGHRYYAHAKSCGDVMRQLKYVTVPGVDLVMYQYYPEQREDRKFQIGYGQLPKYASSAAHVYNRGGGLNWCEIFGGYGQELTYPQMKWMCDWHQYQGCYFLVPHSFNPKSPYDNDFPPYFYNGGYEPRFPLFRVWADYNNRCAALLSGGEHVCRIAQCVPGLSHHVGKTIRPEMFAFAIQDAQLDSDWLGYDAVETARIEMNPRTRRIALRTENGKEYYDILSLPATEYVPFPVLEKAAAFAEKGGVVIGYGIRPCNTPTRGKTASDVQKIVNELFSLPTAFFIEGEPDGARLRAVLAKNYPGENRPLAIREIEFPGLSAVDARMLALCHYWKDGNNVFFIANQDCARRRDLSVRGKWPMSEAELWDPMQGTIERPVIESDLIRLSLEPSQAVFLVWPKRQDAALPIRVEEPNGESIPATFEEMRTPIAAPRAQTPFVSLDGASWIWHPVKPQAGGKVTFRTRIVSFSVQSAKMSFSCDNAAEVFVNGALVASQTHDQGWRAPTTAAFQLKVGANDIEVVADNVKPGPAGFIAAIDWPADRLLTNSEGWTVSRKGERPVKAFEVCAYGAKPWGWFERFTRSPCAESVSTACSFTLPKVEGGERIYLVCDGTEGENSAAVTVNGSFAGGFIGAPYRLDITRFVKEGVNRLEVKPFRLKNPRIAREIR